MIDYTLISYMEEQLRRTPTVFRRYMSDKINWDSRLVGLTGPRGVGKSTMMLQYILSSTERKGMLYVSADHLYFATHSIAELADTFVREGGRWLCIDEIHKYAGWSREVKQIYDGHPDLRIVYTGSSVLDIHKGDADLSRRVLMYHMQGLSFREYLAMRHGVSMPVVGLEQILHDRIDIPGVDHPLPVFRDYLREGYYPFAVEGDFNQRMNQIVAQTTEVDIPQYAGMKAATVRKIRQLLSLVAQSAPYKPNFDNLATEIQVNRANLPDYLAWLEKAGMVGMLRDDTGGFRSLGKVEKVYLDNPSLMSAISDGRPDAGNLRETFFYNQMRLGHDLRASRLADFRIGDRTFEIGGRNKGKKQIQEAREGYVVKDDMEYPVANVIPLYYFGLTY